MTLLSSFLVALSALRLNALRSFLAMLGVIIGVGSVIVMVSVASGAGRAIEERIQALGTNILTISPGSYTSGGRRAGGGTARHFSDDDVEILRDQIPGVSAVAGTISGSATVVAGGINWTTPVTGASLDYLQVRDWRLSAGRDFAPSDIRSAAKMAILGATTAKELFGEGVSPLGQSVRIDNVPFQVIGLLAGKGQSAWGSDQDDVAMVPVTTARRRLLGASETVPNNVRQLIVQVAPGVAMKQVQEEIEVLLRERRRVREGAPDNFRVRDMADFIRARTETQNTLSLLLGATAVISLIVGGIGIMNIMLVSVTERTREIGLRMAVGARRRDILSQFLIEAVALCMTGGLIGLAIGGAGTVALAYWGAWPVAIDLSLVLVALASSGAVGVFFGYYPARQASMMNPIDALRYE